MKNTKPELIEIYDIRPIDPATGKRESAIKGTGEPCDVCGKETWVFCSVETEDGQINIGRECCRNILGITVSSDKVKRSLREQTERDREEIEMELKTNLKETFIKSSEFGKVSNLKGNEVENYKTVREVFKSWFDDNKPEMPKWMNEGVWTYSAHLVYNEII